MSKNSIIRLLFCALVICLTSAVLSGEDEPVRRPAKPSENGMELFSWHNKGEDTWHFALLPAPGADKLKSAQTVMENKTDLAGLKKKLAGLAIGEKVGWFNMLEKTETPPENTVFDFPPKDTVKELELYCTVLKIRLNIYHNAGKKP